MSDKPHILIVDDEPMLRSLLRDCLEPAGFEVSEAGNESELWRMLKLTRVDLITLDLGLGRADGLKIARAVKAVCDIPIVMITGRAAASERVTGLEHGADDYIIKPFEVKEVALRLRNILRRYRAGGARSASVKSEPADWEPELASQ